MMKIAFLIAVACINFYQVSANDAVRVLLNNGEAMPGQECTSEEWTSVVDTVETTYDAIARRRNLLQLQTFPTWCAELCKGYAKGHCTGKHIKCNGYRRKTRVAAPAASQLSAPVTPPATAPVTAPVTAPAPVPSSQPTCQQDIDELNAALDEKSQTFSSTSSCGIVLNSTRTYECLSSIDNCRIQKIQLVNANTDSVTVADFTTGMSFCKTHNVAFKADSDACVCNVQFNLKHSNGTVASSYFAFRKPHVSFDFTHDDNGLVDITGKTLAAGSYTLDYYPDSDDSLLSTIAFTVLNSC